MSRSAHEGEPFAQWRAGADAARLLLQLFPQALGVLAEDGLEIRALHRPQAAFDLALELTWTPADIAHEIARLVRRGLDDVVDRVGAEREVKALHQQHRARARRVVGLDQRDERAAREGPAVVHGVGDLLRRLVLGKEAAERAPRRAVEDHPHMAAIRRGRSDQHRLPVLEVAKRWMRHQDHRLILSLGDGGTAGGEDACDKRDDAKGNAHGASILFLSAHRYTATGFSHKLFPHSARVVAEEQAGAYGQHEPVLARKLAL